MKKATALSTTIGFLAVAAYSCAGNGLKQGGYGAIGSCQDGLAKCGSQMRSGKNKRITLHENRNHPRKE